MAGIGGEAVKRSENLRELTSYSILNSIQANRSVRDGQEKVLFLVFIILAAISICIGVLGGFWEIKLGWSGFEEADRIHYGYLLFTGSISKQLVIENGNLLTIYYDIKVDRGSLTISVIKISGRALWEQKFNQDSFGSVKIGLNDGGVYSIIIKGEGTKGEFDLRWEVS